MERQIRPTEETDHAGTGGANTGRISPAPLFTPGFLDTTGGTLEQRQTAFDRANEDLFAILYLATDKAATLLVAMHAYDERGIRGDGQKAIKELEEKYLRITDETIRALQAALAATTMGPDEDHYIVKAKRLRSRLTAVKEPVTERYFKDIIVQGLPEKYRDIDLTTYKDPDIRSADDPGHYAPYLPGRLVVQQGQGQAYRGTWRGHVRGVSPRPHQHHLPQLRQRRTSQERLRRARQDLRQAEQQSRGEEQEVWRKGKGHHEEMVPASQDHFTQRRRLFQAGGVAPEGGRGVFCHCPRRSLSSFRERREAGHQLRRRLRRRLPVLRSVLTAIARGVTDWGRWSNIIAWDRHHHLSLRTDGTLLLGSLNVIDWDCWDIVSGVATPSASWTAGASYRPGSFIVGLPECHLRNRHIISLGSPERRLSGSVQRTYLRLPGENAFWNRSIFISDRLGLLEQASGVPGRHHV